MQFNIVEVRIAWCSIHTHAFLHSKTRVLILFPIYSIYLGFIWECLSLPLYVVYQCLGMRSYKGPLTSKMCIKASRFVVIIAFSKLWCHFFFYGLSKKILIIGRNGNRSSSGRGSFMLEHASRARPRNLNSHHLINEFFNPQTYRTGPPAMKNLKDISKSQNKPLKT